MTAKISSLLAFCLCVIMIQGARISTVQRTIISARPENENENVAQIQLGNEISNTNDTDFGFEDKVEEKFDELPQWAQVLLGVLGIVIGLLLTCIGYRLFVVSLFLVSAFVSGAILYGILDTSIDDSTENKAAITWGTSFAFGIVIGLLLVKLRRVGVFFLGASFGVLLAMFLNPICLHLIWPSEPVINLYIWMGVFGLIFGLITLCLERTLMILTTAFAGSFLIVLSIGGFAGNFPSYDQVTNQSIDDYPWEWWAYIAGWAFIFLIGSLFQFLKSAKHQDHRKEEHYQRL
mmetsp:Transcript_30702/g.37917  ORF Transcript_30702/g.37917 Transcript_30702/m.37917 type:complete len:291 (-) Transcript_30702:235-1107(-)|eukprot:CAMPEP_0204827558 /NCGR_PEP_ID=MMETSP1346-20131115/4998_1 /ASSEMBLY_ACC=CAM_ASM_000771 /TAXON_ID=215587 /ORGANISM="Aplanochytrium stocchinoi, Strain GSBS06" /LENGTH=290 /DNA_ID=CAMNT_0051956037 /DNA_START=237 /DNA_END=1109 /DNA_ORIENTATION=+